MANYEGGRGRGGDRETEQLRKLFIGGLTANVTEDDLKQHFGQWGELVDVVVMKDKVSGRSRGFGFVTYKEDGSVDEAQTNRPHVFDNKEVETKRAMPRGDSARDESHVRVEKLFVGGLKPETTEDELRDYFSSYGEVVTVEIAKMRETGKPRGFGFITFKDYDPVDKAILYKPHNIGSSTRVDCKKALSKEQMAEVKTRQQQAPYNARGGFAGGRGGYGSGGYSGGYGNGGYGGGYGNGSGGYGGYTDGGYSSGYGDSASYGAGGGYGGEVGGYSEGGEGSYDNGAGGGFGSYSSQGYSGGPSKPMSGGFGGGPQRFQPYGGSPGARGRGRGGSGGFGAPSGGFRGGRGAY